MKSLITLTADGHGTYQVTPLALTAAMAKYPNNTEWGGIHVVVEVGQHDQHFGGEPVPMTAKVTHEFLFDPTDEGDSSLVGDQTYLRVDLFEGSQYQQTLAEVRAAGLGDLDGWIEVRVSDEPKPVAYFKALTTHCAC